MRGYTSTYLTQFTYCLLNPTLLALTTNSFAIILEGNLSKHHSLQSDLAVPSIWYFRYTTLLLMVVINDKKDLTQGTYKADDKHHIHLNVVIGLTPIYFLLLYQQYICSLKACKSHCQQLLSNLYTKYYSLAQYLNKPTPMFCFYLILFFLCCMHI